MATRRRVGVSNATTEAARRQLMQPVVCWEKVWSSSESAPAGSSLKVFKWVKTDKIPHFEDENEVDAPLAPLPDEPEVVEVEEEMEQEEAQPVAEEKVQLDAAEASEAIQEPEESKPSSPKPQLTMSESTMEDTADAGDGLDASLMDTSGMGGDKMTTEEGMELDLSDLGPDGLALADVQDLSQIESGDGLMGGPNMDDTMDPFAADSSATMDEQ
ncbi:hypothetical protein GGU10DRAFT_293987 [Lentinula aff. detonsa]|uniref:Uncharacterized protein n=1 Tax=Lentinula aff. detonsa TaxID=2804958 RepID=A0AA38KVP4_9AGAR|nr:hypothetical protein GGU10DRAFT_293987 [Lentinula aff. detonsa]